MNRTLLIVFVLVAGLLATLWWLDSHDVDTQGVRAPEPQPSLVQAPPPGELRYEAPAIVKSPSPVERARMLELPNHEFVAALNGVRNPPAMEWPADRPFSPIIGRVRTTELEWYVHADGTRSTTQMSFRTELGRFDAVTTVAHPAPVGQLPPGEPGTEPRRQ